MEIEGNYLGEDKITAILKKPGRFRTVDVKVGIHIAPPKKSQGTYE
ncbi:hypothetical protein KAH27_04605 [bacterium]|nr:hypothetical protein [bacterium]